MPKSEDNRAAPGATRRGNPAWKEATTDSWRLSRQVWETDRQTDTPGLHRIAQGPGRSQASRQGSSITPANQFPLRFNYFELSFYHGRVLSDPFLYPHVLNALGNRKMNQQRPHW